jgi:hypothetical protein
MKLKKPATASRLELKPISKLSLHWSLLSQLQASDLIRA